MNTIGVIGLGLLGRGIAACLVGRGHNVIVFEPVPEARAAAREHIAEAMDELLAHGLIEAAAREGWPERYREAADLSAMSGCDLVIESVPEDLALKTRLFSELENYLGSAVPIASNTSALPISILQQGRKHPGRFVGMHWGEPCHVSRFLELIAGQETEPAVLKAVLALARMLGKDACVVRKDVRGFIANRLFYAVAREALYLLESGVADAATIDRSFRNDMGWWATLAGPFRWMDLTGIEAYVRVMEELFPDLSNAREAPETMLRLVESGATGVDRGRGFYEYPGQSAAEWSRNWHEFTWDVRALAEKYTASEPKLQEDSPLSSQEP